jgi:hypothetical protein
MLPIRKAATITAIFVAPLVPLWAQSKLVEDPFPAVELHGLRYRQVRHGQTFGSLPILIEISPNDFRRSQH